MYSLTTSVVTSGVTVSQLQGASDTLASTISGHLSLATALCTVTFIGDAPLTIPLTTHTTSGSGEYDVMFSILLIEFTSSDMANIVDEKLKVYLTDATTTTTTTVVSAVVNSNVTFIDDFSVASGLTLSGIMHVSSVVWNVSPAVGMQRRYSCDITPSLRLAWDIESSGDGVSEGRSGGSVVMSLHMMREGGHTPWFAGGVVDKDAVSMVTTTTPHVVYLYTPSRGDVGVYTIGGYASSDIVRDSRYRVDTGVVGVVTTNERTSLSLQRSRVTGVASDAELMLDTEGGFNTLIWAHGGTWPTAHTSSSTARGFTDVYWSTGQCVNAVVEEIPIVAAIIFVLLLITLLIVAAILVRIQSKSTVLTLLQSGSGVGSLLHSTTSCWSYLPIEISGLSINEVIFCVIFLAFVAIYIEVTARFYIENVGYLPERAYGRATGFSSLLLVGITTLPVTKTSLWMHLLRLPYDRAMKYHRVCAAVSVVVMTVHAWMEVKYWGWDAVVSSDIYMRTGVAYPVSGVVAAVALWVMSLSASLRSSVRYELFQWLHSGCFVSAIVCIIAHTRESSSGVNVLCVPLLLYVCDVTYRLYRLMSPVTLTKSSTTVSGYVELTVSSSRFTTSDIRPGSYYFLHVSECSSGCVWMWQYYQSHPISVCKFSKESNEITFVIKAVGDWSSEVSAAVARRAPVTVRMHGPYGRVGLDLGPSPVGVFPYRCVTLVAGGIGECL